MNFFHIVTSFVSKFLPVWILLFSLVAYLIPDVFHSIQHLTGVWLGIIFLFMGLSLSTEQLLTVIKKPKHAFLGVLLKWTIMVGVSIVVAYTLFPHAPDIATGVILSGTVPSGTSANLYTFIAGGEVALSITMATLDTIISPILTPSLVQLFAGRFVPVAFWPLLLNIIYIVFIPLFAGLFIQWKWPKKTTYIQPYTSILSQLSLFLVVLSVVSSAQVSLQKNLDVLPLIFLAVSIQVIVPMLAGYLIAKLLRIDHPYTIAILFHTGICNTALSATLAMEHISSLAAVPSVANMIVNLTVGALVASILASRKQAAPLANNKQVTTIE